MKSYPFRVLGSFIFLSDGHFLGAKILFSVLALLSEIVT